MTVIWHDLECGGYTADLPTWRALAGRFGAPILDVGAGTGRVTLDLARRGHAVTALDHDPALLQELERRSGGLPVSTLAADARDFKLPERFALIVAPMQTLQLLGGPPGRARFLRCARAHLRPGGRVAAALVEAVETYEALDGVPGPLPDMLERDGIVYSSLPVAVRADADGFVLERRREQIGLRGERHLHEDVVRLDRVSAEQLEAEARAAGLRPAPREEIASTDDHVGSTVVMLDG